MPLKQLDISNFSSIFPRRDLPYFANINGISLVNSSPTSVKSWAEFTNHHSSGNLTIAPVHLFV